MVEVRKFSAPNGFMGGCHDQFKREGISLSATISASSFDHALCARAEAEQTAALSRLLLLIRNVLGEYPDRGAFDRGSGVEQVGCDLLDSVWLPASSAIVRLFVKAGNRPIGASTGRPRWPGYLGLRGLSGRHCANSGFSVGRMAITRGGQVFLKLQPFVERHGRLLALWWRVVNTCFRWRRLGPRI
jgi:hypothetical protein